MTIATVGLDIAKQSFQVHAADSEGRAVSATNGGGSGAYTYDGHGLRVKKVSGSTTTVYIFSGAKVIGEYVNGAAPSAPTREYVYAGGALLAKIDSTGTKYYHQDHLSNRMVTDSSGNVVAQLGHFPFGESWYNASNDKLLFTTYERDAESGNDYAMARYHVSRLGRLSSPDPIAGSAVNPQSLDRYSYSINDPANVTDPSGALPNCNTAETNPKEKSQQGSGDGPSDTDDEGADAAMQSGCPGSHTPPGGWSWAASLGLDGTLDGGFVGDDSGGLPSGDFGPGQSTPGGIDLASQIGLFSIPVYTLDPVYGFLNHPSATWGGQSSNCPSGGGICVVVNTTAQYGITGYEPVQVGTVGLLSFSGPQPAGPGDQNGAHGPGPGPQKPQSQQTRQQQQKKPCDATARTAGALQAAHGVELSAISFGLSALHFQLAADLAAAGCGDFPLDLLTCGASAYGAFHLGAGGLVLGGFGVHEVTHDVIPGVKQALSCTQGG